MHGVVWADLKLAGHFLISEAHYTMSLLLKFGVGL